MKTPCGHWCDAVWFYACHFYFEIFCFEDDFTLHLKNWDFCFETVTSKKGKVSLVFENLEKAFD